MKAVVYTRYGSPDVLEVTEIPTPSPGEGEVLVKIHAVSLNASDWEMLCGKPLYSRIGGLLRPRRHVLGSDIAGRVVACGPKSTRFQPGDDVFADALSTLGGFAEFICVPEKILEPLPAGLTHEQAAALPQSGAIAWQGIVARGEVQGGQRVLINGAGGGSGMYAIQLAKLRGAQVTGVDNAEKLEFMASLGADHVIDYRREDYTRNGKTYDLVLDVQAFRSARDYRRALAPGGRYFYVGGSVRTLFGVLLFGGKRVRVLAIQLGAKQLGSLVELCRAGEVSTVIDRRYSLDEVPEALGYLGNGHARGKVLIVIDQR
ncbi:MAG TPA: NAD(P)-dependent alcohol dehydrogenase [Candidatus Limnocylindrales bacterium]|nr:NAD(P)-dependent alcohol dehydrogenase [Candidatus Limnocylindrales bacterium]